MTAKTAYEDFPFSERRIIDALAASRQLKTGHSDEAARSAYRDEAISLIRTVYGRGWFEGAQAAIEAHEAGFTGRTAIHGMNPYRDARPLPPDPDPEPRPTGRVSVQDFLVAAGPLVADHLVPLTDLANMLTNIGIEVEK